MANKRIDINDLNENTAAELSEDDVRKVTGGLGLRFDNVVSMENRYSFDGVRFNYDIRANKKV